MCVHKLCNENLTNLPPTVLCKSHSSYSCCHSSKFDTLVNQQDYVSPMRSTICRVCRQGFAGKCSLSRTTTPCFAEIFCSRSNLCVATLTECRKALCTRMLVTQALKCSGSTSKSSPLIAIFWGCCCWLSW